MESGRPREVGVNHSDSYRVNIIRSRVSYDMALSPSFILNLVHDIITNPDKQFTGMSQDFHGIFGHDA